MKYIEIVKTTILTLLVALSMLLTFSIWTYTPVYDTIEQLAPVDAAIADKKKYNEIIKPYKTIFNFGDALKGTTNPVEINSFVEELSEWKIADIRSHNNNLSIDNLNTLLRKPNRFTLFFHGEVPLTVYDNVINIDEPIPTVPEISFNRIVVEWNTDNSDMDVYFVSRANKKIYSAKAKPDDNRKLQRSILTDARELADYKEVAPESSSYIVVPVEPVETTKYTFIESDVSPNRFRDALFNDPNAVRSSLVGSKMEELGDNHAIMKIDKENKKFEYVYPTAKIQELAIPSELLSNTVNFVNEHGGWTDDFRYTYMDPKTRTVRFRLFLEGLPVYSDSSTTTEIVQKWGDKQIFNYKRPYYRLDFFIDDKPATLPSGVDVAERLIESKALDFDTVDEIAPGYFMKRNTEKGNIIMEPAWFYLVKGNNTENWHRFSPETLGGALIGLE